MSNERPVLFRNLNEFNRAMQAGRTAEKLGMSDLTQGGQSVGRNTPTTVFVKVTGEAFETAPWQYPGVFVYRNPDPAIPSDPWYVGTECVITPLNPDDEMVEGFIYVGNVVGQRYGGDKAGWPLVAATVSAAASGGFFARLESVDGAAWKWRRLKAAIDGTWTDDGDERDTHDAIPITYDGTSYVADPVPGMRVWMHNGVVSGVYEFMPIAPVNADGGVATGPGWLQGLRTTDCLKLVVLGVSGLCQDIDNTQVVSLAHSAGTWTSAGQTPAVFTYDGGSGTVIFGVTNGVPYLTINGIYMMLDGAGIASGIHYADWAGGIRSAMCSAGTPEDTCGGNIFRVRITCACCPSTVTVTTVGDGTWVATCETIDVECFGKGGAGGG